MAKTIELRRHTASDGDILTAEGVEAAVRIGQTLSGHYELIVSSGAQRATQTAACFLAGMHSYVGGGVVVDGGFRSSNEDRWREIYATTKDAGLDAFLSADYEFVWSEAERFADALRRVTAHTSEGGRSLVVGHSPMLEAAVWAVTEKTIPALKKGGAVVLLHAAGAFTVAE